MSVASRMEDCVPRLKRCLLDTLEEVQGGGIAPTASIAQGDDILDLSYLCRMIKQIDFSGGEQKKHTSSLVNTLSTTTTRMMARGRRPRASQVTRPPSAEQMSVLFEQEDESKCTAVDLKVKNHTPKSGMVKLKKTIPNLLPPFPSSENGNNSRPAVVSEVSDIRRRRQCLKKKDFLLRPFDYVSVDKDGLAELIQSYDARLDTGAATAVAQLFSDLLVRSFTVAGLRLIGLQTRLQCYSTAPITATDLQRVLFEKQPVALIDSFNDLLCRQSSSFVRYGVSVATGAPSISGKELHGAVNDAIQTFVFEVYDLWQPKLYSFSSEALPHMALALQQVFDEVMEVVGQFNLVTTKVEDIIPVLYNSQSLQMAAMSTFNRLDQCKRHFGFDNYLFLVQKQLQACRTSPRQQTCRPLDMDWYRIPKQYVVYR